MKQSLKYINFIVRFNLYPCLLQENYRSLREVFAAKTDVFLVCFSVTDPETLEHAQTSWLEEIRSLGPDTPFLLVGTKTDLRVKPEVIKRLKDADSEPVSTLSGIKIAKRLGALEYVECSARELVGVREIFSTVALVTSPNFNKKGGKRKAEHCLVS